MSQGKILRVKQGYNPNSSSIGSVIFSMSATVVPAVIAFGAVAGMISTAILEYAGKKESRGDAVTPKQPPDAGDMDVP